MLDTMPIKKNRWLLISSGLMGISLIIIIHELGHFLSARYFDVPIPIFSLGFGPALIKYPIGNTVFQIALIPFGGYVDIDQIALAAQPYLAKMIIMLAGIVFNFIFTFIVLAYISRHKDDNPSSLRECISYIRSENKNQGAVIGPIGIIMLIGKTFTLNMRLFWLTLAFISLNIGLFNLLPLPFFDGGKALLFTIQAVSGTAISESYISFISLIFFVFFIAFISRLCINDILQLKKS